jgi:para-aminobenzoate synthetase component 1
MAASNPPLVEELIPCPDPWDVARQLAHLPHLLFLDSSERHPDRGRYSYVMADPVETITDLKDFRTNDSPAVSGLPPFQGGYAGQFGYGLANQFERVPRPRQDEFQVPDLFVNRYDWVVSFDHQRNRAWLVSRGRANSSGLREIKALFESRTPFTGYAKRNEQPSRPDSFVSRPTGGTVGPNVHSNFTRNEYVTAVERAIEYVHAGDTFQVNLSQRLLAPLTEHPLELYGRLRRASPAPYACYFDMGDYQIASASPEQFLKVTDGEVVTRPIKGTRPRGYTPEEDAARLLDLVTNPKDRAENVMIVDLLRNDLGRVCEYGSVRVPKVCEVETYNYVHHLVSEVRGKLRPGLTPFDLLRAAFPGGSVTGAPKVRAMEIIAELEPTARGPYCGSVGFIGFDGAMDSNILIRTFTAGRGWLQFPVGGGIVADSDPEREYEETLHKAAGLLRALKT